MKTMNNVSGTWMVALALLISFSAFAQVRIEKKLVCTDAKRTMTMIELSPIAGASNYFKFTKFELVQSGSEVSKGKIIYNRTLGYDVDRATAQYSYFDKRGEISLNIYAMESEEGTHIAELNDYTRDRWNGDRTDYDSCK